MRLGVFSSVAIYCFEGALELISAKTHGYQIGIRSLVVAFHGIVASSLLHNSLRSTDQLLSAGETGSVRQTWSDSRSDPTSSKSIYQSCFTLTFCVQSAESVKPVILASSFINDGRIDETFSICSVVRTHLEVRWHRELGRDAQGSADLLWKCGWVPAVEVQDQSPTRRHCSERKDDARNGLDGVGVRIPDVGRS